MNYLVAVDTFFPDRPSGSARVAWDIAQIMRDAGHKVTMFCRRQNPDHSEVENFEDVQVIRFDFPKTLSLDPFKIRKKINVGLKAANKYLNKDWDVVHIHTPLHGNVIYEYLGEGPKYVYTVHSPVLWEQRITWASQGLAGKIKTILGTSQLLKEEGGLLRKVDKIHTLSNYTKEVMEEMYGVGDKITRIPHWCRDGFCRNLSINEARRVLDWPENAKIFFTVRRLVPRMGIDIAIKAIAPFLVGKENVFFAIAGIGPLEKELKTLTRSLGVEEKIWFLGRVSDEMLKNCYEAADMFLLPTMALECFGLIAIEAFSYGLPVISSDAAAIPEIVRPILSDCIVPAGDINAMKQKIEQYHNGMLNLPNSNKIIEYVHSNFSKKNITEKIRNFLEN